MSAHTLTRQMVVELSASMPAFPNVVSRILESIDDPGGCLKDLVNVVNHDPLIAARVLSAANKASERTRRNRTVTDTHTALSLIGMSRLREIALIGGVGTFVGQLATEAHTRTLWRHSVAVGVACDELCMYLQGREQQEMALIAGLLHDVGQFWFYSLDSERYRECWSVAMKTLRPIEQVEMEMFGVDHSTLGEWLAVHWGLPAEVCIAIGAHHMPNVALHQSMVPLVHVAEVICNALGLMGEGKSHVHYLSEPACKTLGIEWNQDVREIFGRIEARSQHANAFFG